MKSDAAIAVIIAAFNSEGTVSKAVASALASPLVAEVVLVDDASGDGTASAAQVAANGDERFKVLIQQRNQGPSAARNRAIRESTSPFIAILDADDLYLPGRFEKIMEHTDWDLCADNILFVSHEDEIGQSPPSEGSADSIALTFEGFVRGNIPSRKRQRGELGFLKPVMRREMLDRLNLRYDENCRLGEDFLLYAAALAHGARFKVISNCGYAGLVRGDSLSGRHSGADLRALYEHEEHLLRTLPLTSAQRNALRLHAAGTRRKVIHRDVLATRRDRGVVSGLASAIRNPTALVDIMLDRIAPHEPTSPTPRKLLSSGDFRQFAA